VGRTAGGDDPQARGTALGLGTGRGGAGKEAGGWDEAWPAGSVTVVA
jgi:hypothetical protein